LGEDRLWQLSFAWRDVFLPHSPVAFKEKALFHSPITLSITPALCSYSPFETDVCCWESCFASFFFACAYSLDFLVNRGPFFIPRTIFKHKQSVLIENHIVPQQKYRVGTL